MKCVLLAGGGGLRLWPLSRKVKPKQFLKVDTEFTMLQQTVLRNSSFCDSFMVLTGANYQDIVQEQLQALLPKPYQLLLETVGRNTAPAITMAAMCSNKEEILFVVPADAQIKDDVRYTRALEEAKALAEQGSIVTFGLKPTSAHTGYGYIQHSGNDVIVFKEKPDSLTAQGYLQSGDYLWNSGMFMFQSRVFLEELDKYRPDIFMACKQLFKRLNPLERCSLLPKEDMLRIPAESIDYAVMEQSNRVKVVPSYFEWSDIGNLEAFCETVPIQSGENHVIGSNILLHNCSHIGVINHAPEKLVVLNGLNNVVVANTPDAVYITAYGESAEIKKILSDGIRDTGFL